MATVGVVLMAFLVWTIYRTRMPGSAIVEYVVMFPQAVPRLVFGLGSAMGVAQHPGADLRHALATGLAYLTRLPAAWRPHARGRRPAARSEPGRMRTGLRGIMVPPNAYGDVAVDAPGHRRGWLLIFIASVRELGASIFLMGPNSKVIAPEIVNRLAAGTAARCPPQWRSCRPRPCSSPSLLSSARRRSVEPHRMSAHGGDRGGRRSCASPKLWRLTD